MSAATNENNRLTFDEIPVGMLHIGSTNYTVHAILDHGALTVHKDRAVAVVCGKRGAQYLLLDNGPKFLMTVWNISEVTKGWGGRSFPMGNPWSRLGGFRDRDAVMKMLGREGQ